MSKFKVGDKVIVNNFCSGYSGSKFIGQTGKIIRISEDIDNRESAKFNIEVRFKDNMEVSFNDSELNLLDKKILDIKTLYQELKQPYK